MLSIFSSKSDRPEVDLTISARTFAKVVLLVVATIVLLAVLRQTIYAFTLIVIALFLSLALNAPVSWVARHLPGKLRNSRSSATALSFLIVVVLLGIFLASVVPPIVRQTESFVLNAPETVMHLREQYRNVNDVIVRYHLQGQVDQLTGEITSRLRSSTASAFSAITSLLNSLVSLFTVLVLTFMMLVEGPLWMNLFRQLIPESRREHADKLRHNMYRAVRGYVNGQVILALVASILVLPGLLIFHVSYPFALMALVFICGLIPMVGHTIGALIVTFIALFHSPLSAVGILIYYILYQQIENYLIQPRLQANVTNLSPLIVLMSLLIGISFGGLVGGLVAIPVVACLRVWAIDYLGTHFHLGESILPGEAAKKEYAQR